MTKFVKDLPMSLTVSTALVAIATIVGGTATVVKWTSNVSERIEDLELLQAKSVTQRAAIKKQAEESKIKNAVMLTKIESIENLTQEIRRHQLNQMRGL